MKEKHVRMALVNMAGIIILFAILMVLCKSGVLSNYIKGILMVCCIAVIMACSLNITVGYH